MGDALSAEERRVLERAQRRLAEWRQTRWWMLAFALAELALSAILFAALSRHLPVLDEFIADASARDRTELANAVATLAVTLALKASLSMVTAVFGLHQLVVMVRHWSGRPEDRALATLARRELSRDSSR